MVYLLKIVIFMENPLQMEISSWENQAFSMAMLNNQRVS